MRNIKRQGGSVASFVIVGIVLALVALGVVYGMKHIAMRDQTPPMILPGLSMNREDSQQGDESSEVDDKAQSGDSSSETDEATGDDSSQDSSSDTGDSSTSQSQDTNSSTGSSGGDSSDDGESSVESDKDKGQELGSGSSGESNNTQPDRQAESSLPQSGPTEAASSAAALFALVASGTAYVRSLRRL